MSHVVNTADAKQLLGKWAPVLDNPRLPKISDAYRRQVTATLMENQAIAAQMPQGFDGLTLLTEDAPANQSGTFPGAANLKGYDPILISLVRRAAPNLIAYDLCGVQPMTGPTGLIFALRSRYTSQGGTEALFNEANTAFSSAGLAGSQPGSIPPQGPANTTNYTTATGMTTLQGEGLGTSGNTSIPEMAFSIEKVTATAITRKLKAVYTLEIAQDLKAVHGLDAESELANILSTEILAEINREVIRNINIIASNGASYGTTTAGTFDLDIDSSGRWSKEKWQGLLFQIMRDSNSIAKATRRGRGNVMLTTSDVAAAFATAGILNYTPAFEAATRLGHDDTGPTFVGTLNGFMKVYIDPYTAIGGTDFITVGYKGQSPYDAGVFYCPYIPLQMARAVDPNSFQPAVGFMTRYSLVANPFATAAADGRLAANTNVYYHRFSVVNLL